MEMGSDDDLDKWYEVVTKLVEEAGKLIASKNDVRKDFVCKSGDVDLVTETDQEVERLLISGISSQFPSHKFIGEEQCSDGHKAPLTNDPTWIIDPVDGTMNFVHGFPHSCISIALLINKVAEIGIIFNPMLNQKFTARRGRGAFCNEKRLQVSGEKELSKALITSEFGTSKDPQKLKVVNENFEKISRLSHGIRCLGSAALNISMVAMGAADAYYEMGIHAWDVAAGELLVREAGGVCIDPSGGQFDLMSRRIILAATPDLAMELAKSISQYYPQPRDD